MVYYYCTNCGEEEEFYRENEITQYGTETEYLDNEGDNVDFGDDDIRDTDRSYGDVTCRECDSIAEWFDTEEELEEAKQQYRRDNGLDDEDEESKKTTLKEIIGE